MTRRQELEAQAIKDQLEPSQKEDGASCLAPEDLAHRFGEYLRDGDVRFGIFDGVMATDALKFSEVILQVSESEARILVSEFADHLAEQPEENIPDYWGGSLPV